MGTNFSGTRAKSWWDFQKLSVRGTPAVRWEAAHQITPGLQIVPVFGRHRTDGVNLTRRCCFSVDTWSNQPLCLILLHLLFHKWIYYEKLRCFSGIKGLGDLEFIPVNYTTRHKTALSAFPLLFWHSHLNFSILWSSGFHVCDSRSALKKVFLNLTIKTVSWNQWFQPRALL